MVKTNSTKIPVWTEEKSRVSFEKNERNVFIFAPVR
jgi:hypothetical protein